MGHFSTTIMVLVVICVSAATSYVVIDVSSIECNGLPREQPGLKFSNLETECYRYPELNGGYVWLCDNGHVEYDSTGVKFPTLESGNDTPTN